VNAEQFLKQWIEGKNTIQQPKLLTGILHENADNGVYFVKLVSGSQVRLAPGLIKGGDPAKILSFLHVFSRDPATRYPKILDTCLFRCDELFPETSVPPQV
jgi:hypothetical protein